LVGPITSDAQNTELIKLAREHIALTTIGLLLIMGLINYLDQNIPAASLWLWRCRLR
jgi:hypothetical protein